MALTDQPYIPLYVDDWMNNSKLKLCSPAAHGLMTSIMCLMHKSEVYGRILLNQKFKQTSKHFENFASQIAKQTSFEYAEILPPLIELINEKVIYFSDDFNELICNRMVRDAEISLKRANSGKSGGKKTQRNIKSFAKANAKAKSEANTGNGIVYGNENDNYKIDIEDLQKLWIRTFGRNPKTLEADTTIQFIDKFGYDRTFEIFRNAVHNNFKSVFTLWKNIDEHGNIKPKTNGQQVTEIKLNT